MIASLAAEDFVMYGARNGDVVSCKSSLAMLR
jgi:hypothetical protein